MAKRKRRYSATKCPEPFNTLINIGGAMAMHAYAKRKVKKDYQRGYGKESAEVGAMYFGMNSLRNNDESLVSLGGLTGIASAIEEMVTQPVYPDDSLVSLGDLTSIVSTVKKVETKPVITRHKQTYYDDIDFPPYKTNDNRYAWRLNCEDGSEYGIYPTDYETRQDYNKALTSAKGLISDNLKQDDISKKIIEEFPFKDSTYLCCRVSRLDNGANEYYLTEDETIKIGDTITVTNDFGTSDGIVISIRQISSMNSDELPNESVWLLREENESEIFE